MARRKSDGAGSRADEPTQDAPPQDAPPPDVASDDVGPLPTAGAESAPVPEETGFEGGPVAETEALAAEAFSTEAPATEAPATETVDTAAAGIGDVTPDAGLVPPNLSEPAEPASPEAEAPLHAPEDTASVEPEADRWSVSGPVAEPELAAEPEPAAEPVAAPVHHDGHDDEEESGTSVAAWALGILLLLLAGAAFGTWAAPKIAPALPAGMKPVADWLEPGKADAEAEIAALRDELAGVEAKLGAVPSSGDLDARIGAAVAPVADKLGADLATLRQSIDASGGTEARQQFDSLTADLKNQAAQLETLKSDFSGAAGQVSGDVNVFKADIDGMRAEIESLRAQVSGQASRLDEVARSAEARVASAEQQVAETEQKATTALDAAQAGAQAALIRAAVASGAPYGEPVAALESRGVTVPPALAAGAQAGIPTLASLRDGFPAAAHTAIQASILAAAGDGVLARANAFLKAQVASRSLSPKQGPGTDAVLSRMEDKLRHDDLAGALAESQGLPSEAAAAMSGWLDSAKLRLGATDGLAALASSLPATN
ncbi:MAG: mitofilin family membrane protein [Amaricoccus sp.]|uniref:mitofilin family membrane protein n=1 Tax=Amaricoccus sp. TaxID=1872485 RepID=UPI0039E5E6DC